MENEIIPAPAERPFWRRFPGSGIIAWLALVISVVALVRTLPPSFFIISHHGPKALAAPDGFLLDPKKAKVTDSRGSVFSWREDCRDKRMEDHLPYACWAAEGNDMDYVAYGKASVRGTWRHGVIALANPDNTRLHIEWPIKAKAGQKLKFTCGLTDEAMKNTRKGIKVRVELWRPGANSDVLADDEALEPGDPKVLEISHALMGTENRLTLEIDNCGSEFWTTTYCTAKVE